MKKLPMLAIVVAFGSVLVFTTSCEPAASKVPKAVEPGLPILFSFETDEAVTAWIVEDEIKEEVDVVASDKNATEGKRSLKVTLKSGDWPGIRTSKLPKDWSAYKELKFDIFAEVDFRCAVRIDDAESTEYETQFNGGEDVEKGKNTVTIDLEDMAEAIDLKNVVLLCIFSTDVDTPLTFYLDNVRLVKK